MPSSRVRGGKAWKRFTTNTHRAARTTEPVVEVGFLDRRISILAGRLEFGDPASDLPERPAFRQGVEDLKRAFPALWTKTMRAKDLTKGVVVDEQDLVAVGLAARDILRRSYETFTGPGLSERQEKRKRGTVGEGRELVGHEGPKLIGHLEVRVNGVVVG